MNYYQDFNKRFEGEASAAAGTPEKKQTSLSKGMAIGIACAGVISSSVLGFGGGYLAAGLSPNTVDSAAQSSVIAAPETGTPAAAPVSSDGIMSVSQVASTVSDSVVEINTEQSGVNMMMQTVTAAAAGSGVVVSEDGYIVTNNHVIEGANKIEVRLKNGESYPATLRGTDPKTDLAVIKIEASGLHAAVLGDSSSLVVGSEAIAIGNPLGELGGTVTNGIISALDREINVGDESMNLLQTNAAINPGNSGGGLFNNKGELIGIVVAKSSGSGIEGLGFAIPVDDVKEVITDLISTGYVTGRGELGISVMDISDERTAFMYRVPQLGVYVASVNTGSAAQLAGLVVGDGIVAVGDTEISSSQELKSALDDYSAGERVTLTVLRDGKTQNISVVLTETVPEGAENVEEA